MQRGIAEQWPAVAAADGMFMVMVAIGQGGWPLVVTVLAFRAFGQSLSTGPFDHHRLGDEIGRRVRAVLEGFNPWPLAVHGELADLQERASACFEDAAGSRSARLLEHLALRLRIAPWSRAARITAFDSPHTTRQHRACVHQAVARFQLSGTSACELNVELTVPGGHRTH